MLVKMKCSYKYCGYEGKEDEMNDRGCIKCMGSYHKQFRQDEEEALRIMKKYPEVYGKMKTTAEFLEYHKQKWASENGND